MDPYLVFLILIPIGLLTGIMAALTGLGGGVLMVPILFYAVFEFAPPEFLTMTYATTISSTVIVFTATSGTIAFSIQKRIDYIVGLLCVPFTIGGSFIGKYTQALLTENGDLYVRIFFAVLLFLTAVRMVYKVINSRQKAIKPDTDDCPEPSEKALDAEQAVSETEIIAEPSRYKKALTKLTLAREAEDNCDQTWNYKARIYLAPIALIGGFVASTAGVGGGIIMVPVLHLIIGLPMHFATATSAFIMIFTKLTTVITSYASPKTITDGIWWPYVAGLAIGIIGGVQIGALIAKRIKADPLKITFATVLFLVAVWTVIRLFI